MARMQHFDEIELINQNKWDFCGTTVKMSQHTTNMRYDDKNVVNIKRVFYLD